MHLSTVSGPSGRIQNKALLLPCILSAMKPELISNGRVPTQFALFESIKHQRYRQALLLVEAGVGIDIRNGFGLTPLIYATINIDEPKLRVRFMQLFLDAGVNVNSQDWKGLTALMHACILGRLEAVVVLLEQPEIEMMIEDQTGNTALLHAANKGHLQIVIRLLNVILQQYSMMSPALQHSNSTGHTAYDLSRGRYEDVAHLLTAAAEYPNNFLDHTQFVNDYNNNSNRSQSKNGKISNVCNDETSAKEESQRKADDKLQEKMHKNGSSLPLLSLTIVDVEPWNSENDIRTKSNRRKTITGSRSLNDSVSGSDEPKLSRKFSCSTDQLNSTFSGLTKKDSTVSSFNRLSTTDSNLCIKLHLPPIRKLAAYKTLFSDASIFEK